MRIEYECLNPTCGIGSGSSESIHSDMACQECGVDMVPVYQGEDLTNDEILAIMQDTLNARMPDDE